MGHLNIKPISIEDALELKQVIEISLKRDGALLYWREGKLISPRNIVRNDRFPHIVESMQRCPDCMGEMYKESGTVSDITTKDNWPDAKYMLFARDLGEQGILNRYVELANSWWLTVPVLFDTILGGWKCVCENALEGLVIKTLNKWYKVKRLCEDKVKIVDWLPSKTKGTFILENGNKVSGTKMEYVEQFKASKGDCIAEIEYPYLTKEGRYFQPRLRQITETYDVETAESKA